MNKDQTNVIVEELKVAKIVLQNNIYKLLEKFTDDNGVSVSDLRLNVYKTQPLAVSEPRYYYEVEVKVNL